jgi:hypothetical protein
MWISQHFFSIPQEERLWLLDGQMLREQLLAQVMIASQQWLL